MTDVPATLILKPDELLFSNVRLNQAYCQTVTITNPSKATVEATLRAGSSDRYTVSPTKLVLKPQQSIEVDVRLRLLRFAQKQKALHQGQRDIFHIKAAYFEQKFYATFFLAPEAVSGPASDASQRSNRRECTRSRSPHHSPRDLLVKEHAPPLMSMEASAVVQDPASTELPPTDVQHQASTGQAQFMHPSAVASMHSRGGSPDLSPRGDLEADDPPTPRMYKSIVPAAAARKTVVQQDASHHAKASDKALVTHPQRYSAAKGLSEEASAVVLHQGHYASETGHASPPRHVHARDKSSQHALEQLKQDLRDKDNVIAILKSQLNEARHSISMSDRTSKVTSSIDTAGMSLQAQSQVEKLEVLNAQLEGANADLRDRLHEASAQAEAAKAQVTALQGLQSSLQESAGPSVDALMEAAVGRERALQDARNQKVLELLNNKDEVIQRFEDRCTEANAEIQQLQAAMQESTKRLETADSRLASTMESRNKLRKQLEVKSCEHTSSQASLQAENEVLKDKLREACGRASEKALSSPEQGKLAARLRAELEVHKEALAAAKQEVATLASSLDKANSWIESLNNGLAGKDQDLQAQQERHLAKDQQLAELAQQIEQLESTAEAQQQAETARKVQQSHDWAVNVSLDQGMGDGPVPRVPSSPRALRQRVLVLEGANEKLEKALMAAHSHKPFSNSYGAITSAETGGSAAFEATIQSLRSLLADREQQLGRLEADLAVARAYSGSSQRLVSESAQGESDLRIELDMLRQRLSEKEAQVVSGEERLSRLEAVHRVAQETALRSETQLESTRRSLLELDEDKQAGKEEAESARALALRLNARVSELTLAAECARTDGESARAELERVHQRHQDDIQALEKRQKQLVAALKAVGAQTTPLGLGNTAITSSAAGNRAHTSDVGGNMAHLHSAPSSNVNAKIFGSGIANGSHVCGDSADLNDLNNSNLASWEGGVIGGQGGMTPTEQPSDALLAVRDRNQVQAVEEAELAVAVMQAKLVEAVGSQREAARQLQQAQQAFDSERAHLEQQVRMSKEEGSVRIQTLEDTIRKLGNRSDLHQELARLGGEASFLRRTEARLKSNLGFAEDRTAELQREVTILRQQVASYEASEHEAQLLEDVQRSVTRQSSTGGNIAAKMSGFSRELSSEGSQPHIVARLVERAECSELQLAQVHQELKALKAVATARAAAEGAGTSAAMSAAQVMEERTGDLQRQLLLAQSELKAVKEDAQIQELDKAHLHTQLAEASREVAAAQSRVADTARSNYSSAVVAVPQRPGDSHDCYKQQSQAARQKAEVERRAESCQAAQQEAEQKLQMAQLDLTRLKSKLEARTKALTHAEKAAAQQAEQAQHELSVARRECERNAGDAEDRKVQLSVLVETVETLQAGTPGEKEQRVVSLTAQLTTARMQEAASERRASQLQCEVEEQTMQLQKLQHELDKAQQSLAEKELEVTVGKAAAEAHARDISGLKGELKAHAEASLKAAREVDDARHEASKAEAEVAGMRAALDSARARHFEQLTQERGDAAASLRQAKAASSLTSALNTSSPDSDALTLSAGIDTLVAALKAGRNSAEGTLSAESSASTDMTKGDGDIPHRVVRRMKTMLMEAQAASSKAQADQRIIAAEHAALLSRVRPLEMALECMTSEKEAAVAELQAAASIDATRQVQAQAHADEHISLQARRLATVSEQLEQANAQSLQLSTSLKHAHDLESSHKWQREALQRKLTVCEADVRGLEAKLSAAHMENAGTADASRSQTVEEALDQRDAEIRAYFDTHVLKHVLHPDHQKRSLALTREICGLKVAHQQLIAAHAAAKRNAGAAATQSATLRQQLQTLEERHAALQEARHTSTDQQPPSSDSSTQLASKAQQVYQLQEQLLQHRHKLALQDITVQELNGAVQSAKAQAQQADDGHRALEHSRQQLTEDFASERETLLKEIDVAKQQQQQAIAQAKQEAEASQQAFAAQLQDLHQQSDAAVNARPTAAQYNQVIDAANTAQEQRQQMEEECSMLSQENHRLQAAVQRLEGEVSELKAEAETRGSALDSLEQTLGRIERSVESGRDRSPLTGGHHRGAAGKGPQAAGVSLGQKNISHADAAMAALSRQLVQAKMAEADAQRKHRVSARAELTLRQRLSQREDRISELKEALSDAESRHLGRASSQHRSRPTSPQRIGSMTQHHTLSHADREEIQHSAYVSTQHQQRCVRQLSEQNHNRAVSPEDFENEISQETGGKLQHESPRASDGALPRHRKDSNLGPHYLHQDSIVDDEDQPGRASKLPYFHAEPQSQAGQAQQSPAVETGAQPPAELHTSKTMVQGSKPNADLPTGRDQTAEYSSQIPLGARGRMHSSRGHRSPQQLAGQVSDLKIQLAKRDAEVDYLEAQLAEAVAANRPQPTPQMDSTNAEAIEDLAARAQELESSLQQVQRECAEAVTAALAVVGRPNTPRGSPRSSDESTATASVTAVVKQLVDKLKERDASMKRLRAVAKTATEKASKERAIAAAQPLESSQRAVIRDLSLRVANLTRVNNQLKEERERAQERLRTLRASLGSSKNPAAQEGLPTHPVRPPKGLNPIPGQPTPAARRSRASSVSVPAPEGALVIARTSSEAADDSPGAVPSSPGAVPNRTALDDALPQGRLLEAQAVQGLCQLLEHHLVVLDQSQRPLGSLLQADNAEASSQEAAVPKAAASEAKLSQGARQALAAAAVATSAELTAMRSTLQVLSSHLDALQAGQAEPAAKGNPGSDQEADDCTEDGQTPKQPMLALPAPPAQSTQETAAQTTAVSTHCLSPEASTIHQDSLAAEQLQQAADRAQKWKSRCLKLRQDIAAAQTSAASQEAALNERLTHLEKASEELSQQHHKEIAHLESALAGAEAAKKQMQEQQAQHSTAGESDLQAANAAQAEAEARALSLQGQIDTLRAQAAASRSYLQDEANSLKSALAKEKSERARIVLSLRDTITGLKQAGDVEGRLKADLVQTHEDLASARATQEQLEIRLSQKRSEAKSLAGKLETAQRQLSQHTADAQMAHQQSSQTMTQAQHQIIALQSQLKEAGSSTAELAGKLSAVQHELNEASEGRNNLEKEVTRLEQLNRDIKSACQELQATVDDLARDRQDSASAKWEALMRCRRHRTAVQQMQGDLQAAETHNSSLSEELSRARVREQQAIAQGDRLQKKLDDLQHFSDTERQQLAERHVGMLSELERRMEEERQAMKREAAAMAASAAASGEDRARAVLSARLNEAQQSAFQDITNVAKERRQLSDELESLRSQFKAYQRVKTREISSLDHRVRILLQSQAVAGTMRPDELPSASAAAATAGQHKPVSVRPVKKSAAAHHGKSVFDDSLTESDAGTSAASDNEDLFPALYQAPLAGLMSKGKVQHASLTAAAEVGMALESEAVASAVREADFERMQREAAEAGVASLQDALEKLRQKLKTAQREARAAKDLASSSAAQAAGAQADQQGLQQLQEQLLASQEALKAAKAESARRLKSLQSLQQQGGDGPHLVANAAFLAEKTAKEGAEAKLATLRRTTAHKDDLLKTLKTKVDELEAAVRSAKAADHSLEAQAAESRVRSLQGSLSRKEDTLRELRERMDQACRSAQEKGAQEEAERQAAAVKKIKADVARKECIIKVMQTELEKVQQELAQTEISAQEAAQQQDQHARHGSSAASLAAVRQQARVVLAAMHSLAKLALKASAAMSAAATSLTAPECMPSAQNDVSAAAVAKMVDMSLEEVADLLGGASGNSPSDTDTALLAKETAQVLLQLEAALCTGSGRSASPHKHSSNQEDTQALDDLLLGIQQQASRAETMLAEALSTASAPKQTSMQISAQHSRRRKKAALDPVAKLEEDLLRASHGIEAEMYQDL